MILKCVVFLLVGWNNIFKMCKKFKYAYKIYKMLVLITDTELETRGGDRTFVSLEQLTNCKSIYLKKRKENKTSAKNKIK